MWSPANSSKPRQKSCDCEPQCIDYVRIGKALATAGASGSPCCHYGRRELEKLSALTESSDDRHKATHGRHQRSLLWTS